MNKIKCAVIGTGNMGRHHARVYSEIPEVELVAVSDHNEKVEKEIAAKFGCKYYKDYKKMLKENEIDIASIAVPTDLHKKVACEVLDAGVNVLLEKPIASNLKEAKEIIQKAEENNKKLMVGHIERFNPAIIRLKELIKDGRLGDIISINIKRAGGLPPQLKNANVLLDLGIHDIDISNFLLEEYPQKTYGHKSKNIIDEEEDNGVMLLIYSKATSFIEVNWVTPVKIRALDITGTKGFARLDFIKQTIKLYENNHLNKIRDTFNNNFSDFNEFLSKFDLTDEINIGIKFVEPLRKEIEDFIHSVKYNEEPPVSGKDALKAVEIAINI